MVATGQASKFIVISAVVTEDPANIQKHILQAKLDALNDPFLGGAISVKDSIEVLHANENLPVFRKHFFNSIAMLSGFMSLVLVADKTKVIEKSHRENGDVFYNFLCARLLRSVLHTHEECCVVISRKDAKLKVRENLNKEIDKIRLEFLEQGKAESIPKISFEHHPHYVHSALQVADYIGWAVHRLYEEGDRKAYDLIKHKVSFVKEAYGGKVYTKKNPL